MASYNATTKPLTTQNDGVKGFIVDIAISNTDTVVTDLKNITVVAVYDTYCISKKLTSLKKDDPAVTVSLAVESDTDYDPANLHVAMSYIGS